MKKNFLSFTVFLENLHIKFSENYCIIYNSFAEPCKRFKGSNIKIRVKTFILNYHEFNMYITCITQMSK